MKRNIGFAFLLIIALLLSGCTLDGSDTAIITNQLNSDDTRVSFDTFDDTITFYNTEITSTNGVVNISQNIVTISTAGVYLFSGSSLNARIVVNAGDEDNVFLVLSGLDLTSSEDAPITITNADKVIINLVEGTINTLTDSASSLNDHSACISSSDDLSINGSGSLTINANYKNGIDSNDDLVIAGGNIAILADNDAIKANNSFTMTETTLTLESDNDGIHVESDESSLGNVLLISGTLSVSSYGDGIDASNQVVISSGTYNLVSGVGNSNIDSVSGKGIKATSLIMIKDGEFTINSKDDSIHSNDDLRITGGNFDIYSGDDGIHSDTSLEISGGTFNIARAYEGIESLSLEISGGFIYINSSDDGINGADGTDSSGTFAWDPHAGGGMSSGNASLKITGGTIYINSIGDGVDINGSISMSSGALLVAGPTSSDNGAIDYDGSFTINGGLLVCAGSSGMAQNVSSGSSQTTVLITLSSTTSRMFHLESADGENIATLSPGKSYQSILVSSPKLNVGSSYTIYIGGDMTDFATEIYGYYDGGTYVAGTEYATFSISQTISTVGSSMYR
ncbi:MAG TPA: carbohydrate-binding domain-containing protein [Bacillota bacterium]|nr:carbohydrate-binding domain-containing protein [Bacillota bacterium]